MAPKKGAFDYITLVKKLLEHAKATGEHDGKELEYYIRLTHESVEPFYLESMLAKANKSRRTRAVPSKGGEADADKWRAILQTLPLSPPSTLTPPMSRPRTPPQTNDKALRKLESKSDPIQLTFYKKGKPRDVEYYLK